ncbi:hypothetical protein [Limosilactobacillus ingluviei]|uniref:DUF8033 domain-containing protein n=1 Tax=Limosilactobacillus ingluviei DSM 15946 TaxID=1423760 RepID=A0A0R1UE30_9LACO|nr:hypothetical protein [Limosilactobacillus ingluviei]KRL91671.1 hypothetical protein FC43_GL001091 [Limosilactobacillus ingluviei DSM 15946]
MKTQQMNAYNFQTIAKEARKGRHEYVELKPVYDGRKSFYDKANVLEFENGLKILVSYTTYVAAVLPDGRFLSFGNWSATTRRHQWDFYKQYGRQVAGATLDDFETAMQFNLY